MKPSVKKALFVGGQIIAIALISFALGEATVRIYNHFSPSYLFYNESYNKRFRGKPFASDGNFKLNSLGFKDKEFSPKAENGYRIVALGDSFAFGVVHYEQNYLTLIEAALQKNHPNVDLLNMGISGTGPPDYEELLNDEGLAYKPDLVLVSFFIGNDFVGARRRKLYEYSYMATLFHRAFRVARGYRGPITPAGNADYCDDCPSMTEDRYLKVERGRSGMYVKRNRRFGRSFEAAVSYLQKIQAACRARGIKLLVVLIPDELQINHELEKTVREKFHADVDGGQWDITLPNRTLSSRLNQLAIDHIDLYDAFIAGSAQGRLYKPRDSHWNIAGNRLASGLIAARVEKYLK
jgi:hypothetical protein